MGHEILLWRLRSPLVADFTGDDAETSGAGSACPGPHDLLVAALVCCNSFEAARRLLHHPFLGLLLKVWKWRLYGWRRREPNWAEELHRFIGYRAAAFWRPEEAIPLQRRTMVSPWPFRLAAWLMATFHLGESEALNFPMGRASLYYAAHGEMEGRLDLIGEQFEAMFEIIAQQDRSADFSPLQAGEAGGAV